MKFNVGIESIEAEVKGNILVVSSSEPLRVLSSAVLNGGLKEANGVINVQVPEGSGQNKNDLHWNAEEFLKKQVEVLGLPEGKVVGLLTAAKMKNVTTATRKYGKTTVTLFVTGGKTVAVTAGEPAASKNVEMHGTINIILLVDGNMTDGCMVEAHKTITEAKTVALRELDLRSQFSGDLATGTLTDTVAVACTKRGKVISFAGTFTLIGELIAQCVRQCVKEAICKQEAFAADRPLTERLKERGVEVESILSLQENSSAGSVGRERLKKEVERLFADEKVASLVLASLRFDDDLEKGLIPAGAKVTVEEGDFGNIVSAAIRDYLENKGKTPEKDALKQKLRNERNLSPLATAVLKAIVKKADSETK
jgi:adenosylcobinamide amidohydrolase